MKNVLYILFALLFFGGAVKYHVTAVDLEKTKMQVAEMRGKLNAYRISTHRNAPRLEVNYEYDKIVEMNKFTPELIPYLWAWRQFENGYPGHEYGLKKFFRSGKNEQLEGARIILIQEMARYISKDKHMKDFVEQLGARVNNKDRENWSKGVYKLIKGNN